MKKLLVLLAVLVLLPAAAARADVIWVGSSIPTANVTYSVNGHNFGPGDALVGSIPSTLNGSPLPWLYCVDVTGVITVPGTYQTSVTNDGKVYGNPVNNGGQVAWLLGKYASAPGVNTSALQAAIWEVIYGEDFTLNGPAAVLTAYNTYLGSVGNNSAPVEGFMWLSPLSAAGLPLQGLVSVPEPGSMLLLGTGLIGLAAAFRRRNRK